MKTLFALAIIFTFCGLWLHGYKVGELDRMRDCSEHHFDKKAALDLMDERSAMYQNLVNELDSLRRAHPSPSRLSVYKGLSEVRTDTIFIKM